MSRGVRLYNDHRDMRVIDAFFRQQEIKQLRTTLIVKACLAGSDPDHISQDMVNNIEKGLGELHDKLFPGNEEASKDMLREAEETFKEVGLEEMDLSIEPKNM